MGDQSTSPTRQQLERASRAAYRRARSHFEGAEAVARRRNYSLAYSLLVLSWEEIAKSATLRMVAIGALSIDAKEKGSDSSVSLTQLFGGRGSHHTKQSITSGLAIQIFRMVRLAKLHATLTGRRPTDQEVGALVLAVVRPVRPPAIFTMAPRLRREAAEIRREVAHFAKRAGSFEDCKQAGFYTHLAPYSRSGVGRARRRKDYRGFRHTVGWMLDVASQIAFGNIDLDSMARLDSAEKLRNFAFTHA